MYIIFAFKMEEWLDFAIWYRVEDLYSPSIPKKITGLNPFPDTPFWDRPRFKEDADDN